MGMGTWLVRDEYVGPNRCWPCTAVNLAILVVVAGGVAVVGGVVLALAVLAVGGLLVATRGYIIPGTPQFAPRLVAHLPVSVGHDAPPTQPATDATAASQQAATDGSGDPTAENAPSGEAVLDAFDDAGAFADAEALTLTDSFRRDWRAGMQTVREEDVVAAVSDTRPDVDVERVIDHDGRDWIVVGAGDVTTETWLDPVVAIADVAAVRSATDRGVSHDVAVAGAAPLRALLERCPACDGPLNWEDESCCGGYGTTGPGEILACRECDAAVFSQ